MFLYDEECIINADSINCVTTSDRQLSGGFYYTLCISYTCPEYATTISYRDKKNRDKMVLAIAKYLKAQKSCCIEVN